MVLSKETADLIGRYALHVASLTECDFTDAPSPFLTAAECNAIWQAAEEAEKRVKADETEVAE